MLVNRSLNFFRRDESVITTDSISRPVGIYKYADPLTGFLFEVNGTGEFSVRFETGDGVSSWYSIGELDNFTSSATQSLSSNIALLQYVRAKIDIGPGGGSVTRIKIYFRGK